MLCPSYEERNTKSCLQEGYNFASRVKCWALVSLFFRVFIKYTYTIYFGELRVFGRVFGRIFRVRGFFPVAAKKQRRSSECSLSVGTGKILSNPVRHISPVTLYFLDE